jgi:hypothetical protein
MKLYKYKSYDEYKNIQINANIRKIKWSWVDKNSINMLGDYCLNKLEINPKLILCHGTRQGMEQKYFLEYFNKHNIFPTVIGTEISPTANDYENTIQWDFHDIKESWINNCDIIYSNSFDHTYDPEMCLNKWMLCVSKTGVCILEHGGEQDEVSKPTDPFGATVDEYIKLITKRYNVVDILDNNNLPDDGLTYKGIRTFIIISHKK